jgi:hypothetical protein
VPPSRRSSGTGAAVSEPTVYESLPPLYREWVAEQALSMGLPDPDHFILLLIRLEKQRQDLARYVVSTAGPLPASCAEG